MSADKQKEGEKDSVSKKEPTPKKAKDSESKKGSTPKKSKGKERKHKRSPVKRKRAPPEESSSSSSSSSASDSSGGEDSDGEYTSKRLRFQATSNEEHFKWSLPDDVAEYANKNMKRYVPDKDIKDSVLLENPVPSNINSSFVLDDFLKSLLDDQKRTRQLEFDTTLEKLQQKTVNIFGPLSKVWVNLENAEKAKEDTVEIPLKALTVHIEQAVLLIGQTFNVISYQRRFNILNSIMNDSRKVQKTLKDKADLLENRRK